MEIFLFIKTEDSFQWLAPYGYLIVSLGFVFFFFRVFENWYANSKNRPLYRQFFVYRTLNKEQVLLLEQDFSFYNDLSTKHRKQFQHRVVTFISEKKFIGRQKLEVSGTMKLLIAATACMLSFGRKNYKYDLIDYILVYPDEFYSAANKTKHKGEFNPREKALVLSWKDFKKGYQITNDNFNLGIHEFMHAMQLEARQSRDVDSIRFQKQFQNILKQLTNQELKDTLDKTRYFRKYAFTNQYEFMAVLAEYFIESPAEFKTHFPKLYEYTKKLLNFTFAGY